MSVVRLYEENKTWNVVATISLRYLIWHGGLSIRNYQFRGNEKLYLVRRSLVYFPSLAI